MYYTKVKLNQNDGIIVSLKIIVLLILLNADVKN